MTRKQKLTIHLKRYAFKKGEYSPIRMRKKDRLRRQNGKAGGSGERAGRLFSHPSIPPLQPEEACASVTPQARNTHTKK